nr:uncharacterized protein LOC117864705 [Setaria viridis]
MSEEGADLPHEVEHDHATAPDGSTPAVVGSAIVKLASSNSESVGEMASETSNTGSKPASPALLHAGEDSNTESKIASPVVFHAGEDNTGSKLSSPVVLHAGEGNNAGSKLASPAVLHDGEDNNAGSKLASSAVLHAGEDNNTESKLASPVVLHPGENNRAEYKLAIQAVPHAGEDSTPMSKLACPVVLYAGEGTNADSKMDIPMPHVSVDSNTNARFKHDSPAVLYAELASQVVPHAGPTVLQAGEGNNIQAVPHAGEDNNAGSKLAMSAGLHVGESNNASKFIIQAVTHAGEDNNAESRLSRLGEFQAGEGNNTASKHAIQAVPIASDDNNSGSKIAIEAVPYAGEDNNAGGSKIAMLAALHDGEDKNATSELTIQMVSNAGEDNNAGSKLASPAAVNADDNNVEKGKNNIVGEGRGRGRGRGNGKGKGVATEEEKGLHIWTERERRKKMKNMFSTLHALLPRLPEKVDKSTIVAEAVTYIRSLEGTIKSLEKLKQDRIRAQQVAAGASCSRAAPPPPLPPPAPAAPTREAILADMVQSWNAQEAIMAELRAAASAVVSGVPRAVGSSSAAAAAPALAPAPALQTWSGPNIVVCIAGSDAFINLCTPRRPGMLTRLLHVLERHRINVMAATISSDQTRSFFSIQARINEATPPPPMLPGNLRAEERYKLAVGEMLHAIAN